jgi:phosphatidylglycerol:prolipoprotein diacylglycerol transferase
VGKTWLSALIMIKISLSPFAFGNMSWYVLFYSLGGGVVLTSVWLLVKKGLLPSYRLVMLFVPVIVLFAVFFARLFYVIDMREYYAQFPEQIFSLNGLFMNGALFGAACSLWLCSRAAKVSFGRCMDAITPAIIVGQILGRVGCFLNGCCYGLETDLIWGITYTHNPRFIGDGAAYHPWQIYEIMFLLVTLGVITLLKPKLKTPGLIFATFLEMYSVWRLAGGFLRPRGDFFLGLQQAQVVSLVVLAFSVAFLRRRADRHKTLS